MPFVPQHMLLPTEPPGYLSENAPNPPTVMETFELDETNVNPPLKYGHLFGKIAAASRISIEKFNRSVVSPIMRAIGPVREGVAYLDRTYELVIIKLGNPLVVKRLIYVMFVVVLMNSLYYAERNDSVKGVSGGGFTDGKLFDIDLLASNLRQYIDPLVLKENIEYVSSVLRFPGSVGDLALARYVQTYYTNNGIKTAYIGEHKAYINYPVAEGTYLKLSDGSFEASLGQGDNIQQLAFNPGALGTSEEIEAPYVFANFGSEADFLRLSSADVSLDGCIVLLKYGGSLPESLKVSMAFRMGAKAVVFVTSPTEWTGATNEEYINKKGVGKTRFSPGNLLDPSWEPQLKLKPNLDWNASGATPKIPTIPISWKDGSHLIDQLKNSGIQFDDGPFSGTPATSKKLKLSIKLEERPEQPIWDVVGTIKGREQSSKGVIFGASRDSVCNGASTSATSTAVLLELVKVFTSLQRQYEWSPSRTIYFVSFDATDYNLAGSSMWVNKGKKELLNQGYTYIDVNDIHVGDILSVVANPLLHDVIMEEMSKVVIKSEHFQGSQNLFQLYALQHDGKTDFPSNFLENKNYVPFVNTLNIPSMDIGFRAPNGMDQPLQSCLDLFENLNTNLDGRMEHQVAIVELFARLGLRLAEEPMIPFNFNRFANHMVRFKDDLQKVIDEEDRMHGISLSDLNRGVTKLLQGAQSLEEFKKDWKEFLQNSDAMEPVMLANTRRYTNENVVAFNRLFVGKEERGSRPGYNNFLTGTTFFAPQSLDNQHEWSSFPFVRDAILIGDPRAAVAELERLGLALAEGAALIMTYG
ncbi:hypothetical protein PUMCH_003668 [Australozyma saopauloensis]|uniref:FXNA-related family protease 1 n=1 Tax=Australozyma saopauloensis TaxID=291208 RepID=A0AAX4HDF2_9ASCO|nr:hypothetical protein PUMCH_003668 [[Candida] saopauloensis]